MKKLFYIIGLLLIGSLVAVAQENANEDVIFLYLKKGMTLEGKLLEFEPGQYIVIETKNGHKIKVSDHKIKRYYYPSNTNQEPRLDPIEKGYIFKEKGFYQYATFGLIMNTVSSSDGGRVGYEMTASAGYQINRLFGAGVGVGADFYRTGASEMAFPLFGELRGYFKREPSTPYYVVRSGYGFATKDEGAGTNTLNGGGWMFNPALGWRLGSGRGLKMTMDIGLHFQHAEFDYSQGAETSIVDLNYRRLNLRIGFLF